MIESQVTSVPLRRPFGTTLMPSGEIVTVYTWPLCSSSLLMLLSSLVAMELAVLGLGLVTVDAETNRDQSTGVQNQPDAGSSTSSQVAPVVVLMRKVYRAAIPDVKT